MHMFMRAASLLLALFAQAAVVASQHSPPQTIFEIGAQRRPVDVRYVFTNFLHKDEHQMYVYTSDDGTKWDKLAGPAFIPPDGTTIRDPSLIYHTECVLFVYINPHSYSFNYQWSILYLL
jgi:hypothetical protein